MNDNEIYSNKITKGSRTYFFDIKKSEKGDLYLKISESKKTASGFEHHRLMIFDEDLNDFVETLKKSLTKFKELKENYSEMTGELNKYKDVLVKFEEVEDKIKKSILV